MSRILIVDDEPAILDAIAILLADEGYSVQTAPDGRFALAMLAGELPDLNITDVMMPGLDGWALLAQVRARPPDLPVIVISAGDAGDRRLFQRAEALGEPVSKLNVIPPLLDAQSSKGSLRLKRILAISHAPLANDSSPRLVRLRTNDAVANRSRRAAVGRATTEPQRREATR